MHPWDLLVVTGTRRASVHVAVVRAWHRVALDAGLMFEIPLGELGGGRLTTLVAQLGDLSDHVDVSGEVTWMAAGSSNVALGEWSSGPVDVTSRGVFVHGSAVTSWDGQKLSSDAGVRDTPWELLRFSSQAQVVATSQSSAWRHHLTAVQRALADFSSPVRVECVTQG